MEKFTRIDDMDAEGFILVSDRLPDKSGIYECVIRGGAMSKYYYKGEMRFSREKRMFDRFDWNEVIMWGNLIDHC